jgi:DNA-binding MarR family transcriptional regulator
MFGELEIFLKEIDSSNKAFEQKHFEKLLVTVYYLGGRHGESAKLKNVKDKTNMSSKAISRTIEDAVNKGYLETTNLSIDDIEELKMTQTGRRHVENLLD